MWNNIVFYCISKFLTYTLKCQIHSELGHCCHLSNPIYIVLYVYIARYLTYSYIQAVLQLGTYTENYKQPGQNNNPTHSNNFLTIAKIKASYFDSIPKLLWFWLHASLIPLLENENGCLQPVGPNRRPHLYYTFKCDNAHGRAVL